ncbi:MAG TPA: FtsQ-type POTRA domain-containing protein [Terriglobales bacterium]|nr:FtsQ-type POTRA domain-containing protein [Terriglobales bacterium]
MKKASILGVLVLLFLWVRGIELFFTESTIFSLKNIAITGNEGVSQDEVLKLADMRLKQNIFKVDLGDIERKIQKDKRVKSVETYRILPNQVAIRIEEKKPDLILNLSPELCGLSSEGEFIPLREGKAYDLPIVNGINTRSFKLYSRAEEPRIEEALAFYNAVKEKLPEFLDQISEIDLEDQDNLSVILVKSGARILFGTGDFQKKIERFVWLEKAAVVEECSCLDFRFKDQVIFKGAKKNL